MATNYREMIRGESLTANATTNLYAAPANTQAAIHAASVSNPTASPVTVSLYKAPSGGSASNSLLIARRLVPAGQVVTLHDAINHVMEPGSLLLASGLGCGLNVSGVEYVPDN